jgi:ABC-type uncharacterized transport system permease subunit
VPALSGRLGRAAEALAIPLGALAVALAVFGLFMAVLQHNPLEVYALIYQGAFASPFAWQNTLTRAAPLVLTALCVALPAQAGLMVIGGEGALVLGGLAAAVVGHLLLGAAPLTVKLAMAGAGMLGSLPGLDVHWGLAFGAIFSLAAWVLVRRTTWGFGLRVMGGNVRAARLAGLPVGRLLLAACALGGAAAGLAGMVEVAAVHGSANASLAAGYGYAGILVAFIARQNPLAVVPVAVLLGGISASGGMLQRRLDLPDATVLVLQGVAFMLILASETLYGRLAFFRGADAP